MEEEGCTVPAPHGERWSQPRAPRGCSNPYGVPRRCSAFPKARQGEMQHPRCRGPRGSAHGSSSSSHRCSLGTHTPSLQLATGLSARQGGSRGPTHRCSGVAVEPAAPASRPRGLWGPRGATAQPHCSAALAGAGSPLPSAGSQPFLQHSG